MKNIEIKVGVKGYSDLVSKLKKIKAKHEGKILQKDIYYQCAKGRLKLREINKKNYELIFYKRPDFKKSKISDYQIVNLNKENGKIVNILLTNICGLKNIVKKTRDLWIYKNTRIHLDKIENLGDFLELETIIKNSGINNAKKEHLNLMKLLGLSHFKKYKQSYGEMLK